MNVGARSFLKKDSVFRGKSTSTCLREGGGYGKTLLLRPFVPHRNLIAFNQRGIPVSQKKLEEYQAYQLAMRLFELVVEDVTPLARTPALQKLVSQHLGSADSIAANIEESFGRESRKEYKRFLVIARGSARETRGRYIRLQKWFGEGVVRDRSARCDHIISILTKTIIHFSKNH